MSGDPVSDPAASARQLEKAKAKNATRRLKFQARQAEKSFSRFTFLHLLVATNLPFLVCFSFVFLLLDFERDLDGAPGAPATT